MAKEEAMKNFFKAHVLRRGGDERSFHDHVNQKMISSMYVDRKETHPLTNSSEDKVNENSSFQDQVTEEEMMKEVLWTWTARKI
jgi:peptide methionine sulfoxide reductase MsrB